MASLRGIALIFAVRTGFVASLKTKDSTKNSWPFQDLFQLDEDLSVAKQLMSQPIKGEPLALVGGQKIKGGQAVKGAMQKPSGNRPVKNFPSAPNWCDAAVTNNLGGLGPDTSAAAELRYANIKGIITAEQVPAIDMVVTALSSYTSQHPERNGFNSGTGNEGCFGVVNLDDSHGPTSVDLEFKFVESGTDKAVHVPVFEFLLYDIDAGKNFTAIESLTIYNDIHRYLKTATAKFSESGSLRGSDSSSGVTFTATTVGDGADNPQDPDNLTQDQMDKTFVGIYKDVSTFRVTFSLTGGDGGRNFMFSGKSPAGSIPEVPKCKAGDCIVWGDPHVFTFDAHREFAMQHPNPRAFFQMHSNRRSDVVNVMEEGQFWLVKSDEVHIQGRYSKRPHTNTTVLAGLAVGGPFLKGNTFIVRPLVGKITWNGKEVLSNLGSEFSTNLIHAKYQAGVKNVKDGSNGNGLEVSLPGDVNLIVNRLTRGLAVKISMCAREWQDGQCGNFNGDSKDDVQNLLMERVQPLRHREQLRWREHLEPKGYLFVPSTY